MSSDSFESYEYTYVDKKSGAKFPFKVELWYDYDANIENMDEEFVAVFKDTAETFYDRLDDDEVDHLHLVGEVSDDFHMQWHAGLVIPLPDTLAVNTRLHNYVSLPAMVDAYRNFTGSTGTFDEVKAMCCNYIELVEAYERSDWSYIIAVVEMLDNEGNPTGLEESCGGYESFMFNKYDKFASEETLKDGEYVLDDLCSQCVYEYVRKGNNNQQVMNF